MKQVKLIKTNEGVDFWLKNDDESQKYSRGEFVAREQSFRAFPNGDRKKEVLFKKDKKVWVKF